MPRPYHEIIAALYKPLSFGVRQAGQNFRNIKNFSEIVGKLLSEAQQLPLQGHDRQLLNDLSADFADFEHLNLEQQIERVQAAFGRLPKSPPDKSKAVKVAVPLPTSPLHQPLTVIHGVGKANAEKLNRKNIRNLEDALYDLPLRYEDRSALAPIGQAEAGKWCTVRAKVLQAQVSKTRRGLGVLTVLVGDETGSLLAKWFYYRGKIPDKRFTPGNELILSGSLSVYRGRLQLQHPEVEVLDQVPGESLLMEERIVPVYGLTEGLNQRYYRHIQRQVAQHYAHLLPDVLPVGIQTRFAFPSLAQSIFFVHCPDKDSQLDLLNHHRSPAQKRIIFEELFFLALSVELRRRKITQLPAFALSQPAKPAGSPSTLLRRLLAFQLTAAQERVLGEIYRDLQTPFAMNRLLQGDVGSGKTVVALFTALRAIENGFQVAFMAPTEILAEQHFLSLSPLLGQLRLRAVCLTGSTSKSQREKILREVSDGKVHVILGTHALLEEEVRFKRLGLVIVDEQHRFGVMQRVALRNKGQNPHALVMTATPIPRTLAMTVYGDLNLSVIAELPPGRMPIKTQILRESDRATLYREIAQHVKKGNQVYVVYPLVEESETLDLKNAMDMFDELSKNVFPQFKLALLHGRMKSQEKEAVMADFKAGTVQILVSTSVVEVGIDVPNATLIVIEHAERFGLSQLHQLRGRVGRGRVASKCILMVEKRLTHEARQRLSIMVKTTDGFRIAEEDLRIRGPGEVLGTRQAGLPIFCYAELRRDAEIFDQATLVAKEILAADPHLEAPENQGLREALQDKWQGRLQLSRIG